MHQFSIARPIYRGDLLRALHTAAPRAIIATAAPIKIIKITENAGPVVPVWLSSAGATAAVANEVGWLAVKEDCDGPGLELIGEEGEGVGCAGGFTVNVRTPVIGCPSAETTR